MAGTPLESGVAEVHGAGEASALSCHGRASREMSHSASTLQRIKVKSGVSGPSEGGEVQNENLKDDRKGRASRSAGGGGRLPGREPAWKQSPACLRSQESWSGRRAAAGGEWSTRRPEMQAGAGCCGVPTRGTAGVTRFTFFKDSHHDGVERQEPEDRNPGYFSNSEQRSKRLRRGGCIWR